jgi:hypothetical protein
VRDGSARHSKRHSVPCRSCAATRPLAGPHYRFKITMHKIQKSSTGKDNGPTHRFTTSPRVGPGATIGTLKTGYPRLQALSQDEGTRRALMRTHVSRGSSSHLLAQDSSGATTCPTASALASRLRAAPEPPRVLWLQLSPPGLGRLRGHHVSRG